MSNDPENYALDQIREWVTDAMQSESTPEEIYNVFVDTVKNNMRYHKACYNSGVRLLALLRANTNPNIEVIDGNSQPLKVRSEESAYWNGELYGEDWDNALEKYGYAYTPINEEERERFRLDSPYLNGDVDLDEEVK